MRYVLRDRVLSFEGGKSLLKIKSLFSTSQKRILFMNDELAAKTIIRSKECETANSSDVRAHAYVMLDAQGMEMAVGSPDYAEGEDPIVAGWPICRMPRVDHASIDLGEKICLLKMLNNRNYQLLDDKGQIVVQIVHKGLIGGWDIDASDCLSPTFLCALFAFCRYIEKENELLVV